MDLVIIFFGLIVHVNQPGTLDNTAVLPLVEHHQARMFIPAEAVANADDEWVKTVCTSGRCVIDIAGYNITVTGTRGMFSMMSDELQEALPSLRTLAPKCGGLRDEIRWRRPGSKEFTAFIDYRGGRRTILMPFARKASFPEAPPWDQERCLACKVEYRASLSGDYAILFFRRHDNGVTTKLHVNKGSTIEVHHVPSPTHLAEAAEETHFGHYYRIFERAHCRPPLPEPSNNTCDEPVCRFNDPALVMLYPQADCTQTGYP